MAHAESSLPVLTMRAGSRLCAVPIAYTVEVMRPLPVEQLAGAPSFVLGLAIIRGRATPVMNLAALLAEGAAAPITSSARFVTLRVGSRGIALHVEAVLAIRTLEPAQLAALPLLWQGANAPAVKALAMLDRELLLVLEAARLLPEDESLFEQKENG